MKNKVYVGMKVYRRNKGEVTGHIISKVGNKYFYVSDDYQERKINIDTLLYTNKDYSQFNIQYYQSEKEIKDEIELNDLHEKVRMYFVSSYRVRNTIEELRKIAEILNIN